MCVSVIDCFCDAAADAAHAQLIAFYAAFFGRIALMDPRPLMGMEGDFSIDKRRANSKDSLEIIKYIVIKGIVTYGRKLIIFTNFLA